MNKTNFVVKSHLYISLCLVLWSYPMLAQNTTQQIKLQNEKEQPIIGARFDYGSQQGASDAHGIFSIHHVEGDTLFLSHLNFGAWYLTNDQVISAMENGAIERTEKIIQIQPVSIIALRPKYSELKNIDIDNQSRLSHDASAILNRIGAISSIRKGGGYGFDPVMRGYKYDQLNIVIDGVQSATSACPNRMDPPTSQIAPNMMERIEILKGPHSLRYGTAFGGTINFVSVSPNFSSKKEMYGRLSGNYESNGNIKRGETMVGVRGSKAEFGIFGSWSEGDDYKDGEGREVQSDFARGSVGANLGLKLKSNQMVKLSATRNFATDADFPALAMDLRKDDTWLFNASHHYSKNSGNLQSWNTALYTTNVDHLMDNLLKPLDPRMMNASTNAMTKTYGGRTEGTYKFKQNSLYIGADLRIEHAEGKRERTFLLGPDAGNTVIDNIWQNGQISHTGVFTEYHFGQGKTKFVASGRLEMNDAKLDDAASEFTAVNAENTSTQINPSFSIGGINNFNQHFSIGLWLGRAQRSGSLTERFINYVAVGVDPYEMLGNPDIDPEINNQVDLTFGYKSKNTMVDVGLFTSFLEDYIYSTIDTSLAPRIASSPGVRQFTNLDKALMTGFEVTWNQALPYHLQHQMSVTYTYGENNVDDSPLPEIAPLDFRFILSGSYFKNTFQPKILLRHVLNQARIANEFGESETPAFTLVDINAKYRFTESMSMSAGVQNLLDEAYYEHLSRSVRGSADAIYSPGTSVTVSLVYDITN